MPDPAPKSNPLPTLCMVNPTKRPILRSPSQPCIIRRMHPQGLALPVPRFAPRSRGAAGSAPAAAAHPRRACMHEPSTDRPPPHGWAALSLESHAQTDQRGLACGQGCAVVRAPARLRR
jgi:hypothetical protein